MSGRVAFVVQRCGLEVNGGAELLCRMVAERLARHLKVEVLTTCALDYMTWENHYPPGEERLGELRIRRFPVERLRDVDSFNRLSESVRARKGKLSIAEQEACGLGHRVIDGSKSAAADGLLNRAFQLIG